MVNPYASRPAYTFWRSGIAESDLGRLDPVTSVPFRLSKSDAVATAGSCFAQHISNTLVGGGFNFLLTESGPATPGATDENYGVFSARYGNVYTVRQLLQLFDRAYGLFEPQDSWWQNTLGRVVDPFRPRIQSDGFETIDALETDRLAHLRAVRDMFEKASIFIFTLGLTEGWISTIDGAVVPLPPGVCKIVKHAGDYQPVNFTITSMIRDLNETIAKIRAVNPGIRILLTVSPVPLIATFEDRHVLVSTTYSKSALRVVAEEVVRSDPKSVAYFPSYEMITAPATKGIYFASDLRSVTPDGVAHVMSVFRRHFLCDFPELPDENQPLTKANEVSTEVLPHDRERFRILSTVVCDEEAIAENVA